MLIKSNEQTFPKLIALMKIFAALAATSVESERLFSKAEIICANKHRNRLSSKRAQDILIIKCNCRKIKMVWVKLWSNVQTTAVRQRTTKTLLASTMQSKYESVIVLCCSKLLMLLNIILKSMLCCLALIWLLSVARYECCIFAFAIRTECYCCSDATRQN